MNWNQFRQCKSILILKMMQAEALLSVQWSWISTGIGHIAEGQAQRAALARGNPGARKVKITHSCF